MKDSHVHGTRALGEKAACAEAKLLGWWSTSQRGHHETDKHNWSDRQTKQERSLRECELHAKQ